MQAQPDNFLTASGSLKLTRAMTPMPRGILVKTFAFFVLIAAGVTYAQAPPASKSKSEAEKIASALQAGPKFVTRNATVLDWPTSPGGEYRVLRAGTNGWICLPGLPRKPHDEPGCFDQVFLQFIKAVWPVARPICRVSEFHICMAASGYLISMPWELVMNSMLGHTS